MPSKSDQLKALLSQVRALPGVDGAAFVSRDGLPVLAELPPSFDRETFSAMIAAMVGAGETALIEAGRGVPDRVLLENGESVVLAAGVSDRLLLVVVGRAGGERGRLFEIAQTVALELEKRGV